MSDLQGDGTYEWDSEEPISYTNYDGNFPMGVVYGTMNFWQGTWTLDQGLAIRPHILEVECGTTGGNGITINDCSSDIIVIGTHANNYNEVVTWNIPTATTDCPNGGIQITQIAGTPSGSSYFPVPAGHPVVMKSQMHAEIWKHVYSLFMLNLKNLYMNAPLTLQLLQLQKQEQLLIMNLQH